MSHLAFSAAPGVPFRLAELDPGFTGGFDGGDKGDKKDARRRAEENQERLHELQEVLYAQGKHSLLIVLQALDTAGKDSTIEHVMGAFNPQGVVVTPFKAPTEEELAHDFLWRVHEATPRRGMIAIFNRSHYEDVLVVRVKELVPEAVWRPRYEHINAFEKLLAESGTAIVKFYLHISPEEQAERLRDRQNTPHKHWKFNPGDLADRALWRRYMEAYDEALTRCNTPWAPWYVIPANRKWIRNLAVSEVLIQALEGLDLAYPEPPPDIDSYTIPDVSWP